MTRDTFIRRAATVAALAAVALLLCCLPSHAADYALMDAGWIALTRVEAVTFAALIFLAGFLVGGLVVCPPVKEDA